MARRRRSEVEIESEGAAPVGVPISKTVTAYFVDARGIEVAGPHAELWGMTVPDRARSLAAEAARYRSLQMFVWLDPPEDADVAAIEAALDAAGVPHKRAPRRTPDAVVPVASVATPAQVSASMRDVVEQLADEVAADWPEDDAIVLDETLDVAMSKAGL